MYVPSSLLMYVILTPGCAITQSTPCKVRLPLSCHNRPPDATFTDYAINNKLTPFISMQNHHNLVYREEEREMFPTLKVRSILLLHVPQLTLCCSSLALDLSLGRLWPAAYLLALLATPRRVGRLTDSSRATRVPARLTSSNGASALPRSSFCSISTSYVLQD